MSDADLIAMARLAQRDERMSSGALYGDLADRIEALIAERDEANKRGDAWRFRADIAEVKLAKAVEALQWCSGSADFNEGGVAREGWLKVCAPLLKGESHE